MISTCAIAIAASTASLRTASRSWRWSRRGIPRERSDVLNARRVHWLVQTIGHLKPGVTRAQAVADLNSIGVYLEKTYPKEDGNMTFALGRPGLYGDFLGPVVQGFLVGLMMLA